MQLRRSNYWQKRVYSSSTLKGEWQHIHFAACDGGTICQKKGRWRGSPCGGRVSAPPTVLCSTVTGSMVKRFVFPSCNLCTANFMTCLWGSCHVSIQLYSDTILVTRIEIAAVGHLGWWWFLSKQRFVNLNDSSHERIWFWVQCVPFSLGASCYCISTLVQNEEMIKRTQRSSSSYGVPIINGLLKFRVTVHAKSQFIFLKSISNYSPLIIHIFSSEAWIATFYVSVCHRFDYTTEMWLAEDHLEWTGWLGCVE